jgi:hypothetical protein
MAKKGKRGSGRRTKRDARSAIKKLDVSTLHDDAVTDVMLHCAAVLNLRKAISAESSASYCYTKAGNSSTVTIWSGGFIVGERSEAEAKASGIRPCG